jgi:hypothetical protein
MLRFNIIQIKLILIIFCSNAWTKNFDIDIIFESGFVFESQNIFINNIKNTKSKQDIEDLIKSQDWIARYSLKFIPFSNRATLNILNRTPQFILNNEFYVDEKLQLFKFDNTLSNLIIVTGPIGDMAMVFKLINSIENSNMRNPLIIKKINFNFTSGWIIKTDRYVIKLGNNLDDNKFKSLKDTLNYLYDKRKIPSMIDLRYKDGVALNYGK